MASTGTSGDNSANIVKEAKFIYRLTFGNNISNPGTQLSELKLEQGVQTTITDDENKKAYYLTFKGIKINRRIFQPTKIEVELDFLEQTTTTTASGTTTSVNQAAPSVKDVSDLLLERQVKVEIIHANRVEDTTETTDYGNTFTVAENCYVYELFPQLKRENNTIVMSVKLDIFSIDKLMTLNKYSKAYVARKLGSGILKNESQSFGMQADNLTPMVGTVINVESLNFLTYNNNGNKAEFIHPYLVQYNESFYDFLARSANRYGEFLYFENGKLTLGLTDSTETTINDFNAVTIQNSSDAPLEVSYYRRDSAKKDNGEVGELNHDPIGKNGAGYPKDAFPESGEYQYNAEAVNDEYIFPLVKDKFTNLKREKKYNLETGHDIAMSRILTILKPFLQSEFNEWYIGLIVSAVQAFLVDEAIDVAKISAILAITGGGNAAKNENHITPWDDLTEQSDGTNVTQFGTLDPAGWMTLNAWSKIHKHQEDRQRHIICIDMGTSYADVRIGQKIKVTGLDDTYTIIQVQEVSEEPWSVDYNQYGSTASDMYSDRRSQKIYAIPGYKEDNKEKFVPPLLPTPAFRRSGAQTAFVTDNDDPKYQGRVRVMYPWQTKAEVTAMKRKSEESHSKLQQATKEYNDALATKESLLNKYTALKKEYDDILAFLKKTPEERTAILEQKQNNIAQLKAELNNLNTDEAALKAQKTEKEKLIKEKEAIENPTEEQQVELEAEKAKLVVIQAQIDAIPNKRKQLEGDINKAEAELKDYQDAHTDKFDSNTGKDKTYYNDKDNPVLIRLNTEAGSAKAKEIVAENNVKTKEKNLNDAKTAAESVDNLLTEFLRTLSTPWIRVATPMATPGGGTYFRPRIGDEVLVDYDNGNIERPYVLGSLFSKNVLEPHEMLQRRANPESQWENISMAMVSPNGHHITFTDPPGGAGFITNVFSPGLGMYGAMFGINSLGSNYRDLNGGIHIGDRYGVYEIEMLTHKRAINIRSPFGTVDINAFSGITISAPNGNVTIKGKNITLEAGNKITMNSGKNLPVPEPDEAPTTKTKMASIGKAILHGAAGAVTDLFASPLIDLSLIRHVIEVYVRPVDGTMLIKSRKFLRLEAGLGRTVIPHDKYNNSPQELMDNQIFFLALRDRVQHIATKIEEYFNTCKENRTTFQDTQRAYFNAASKLMTDYTSVDVATIALNDHQDRSANLKEKYEGKFRNNVNYNGRQLNTPEEMLNILEPLAIAYYKATQKYIDQCRNEKFINHILYRNPNLTCAWLDEVLFNTASEGWASEQFNQWTKTFKDERKEELENRKYNVTYNSNPLLYGKRTLFKRTFLLVYLYNVSQAQQNTIVPGPTPLKHIYIGYKLNDITNPNYIQLDSEHWWKRQVDVIDNERQNSLLRGLWENTIKKIKDQFYADITGLKDKQVWSSDLNGQILFSDSEDATHRFEGDGVRRETDANQGSMTHLKWMLWNIK